MTGISGFFFWVAMGSLIALVYASFFEWLLHRFVMHRPLGPFRYPFVAHAMVHHRVFRADETYHLIHAKDAETIPMAWWNGPVLVLLGISPFVATAWVFGNWGLLCGAGLVCAGYYGAYEYMHWCMHLPKKRSVERSGIFFRLNGHHLLHHRCMGKNFNVVFPLADLLLGTLLLRSPVHFKQARGPSLPEVQPKTNKPDLAAVSIVSH